MHIRLKERKEQEGTGRNREEQEARKHTEKIFAKKKVKARIIMSKEIAWKERVEGLK